MAELAALEERVAENTTRLVEISGADGKGGELKAIREAIRARNQRQSVAIGLLVPLIAGAIAGWISLRSQFAELRGHYQHSSQQQERILDRLERIEVRIP